MLVKPRLRRLTATASVTVSFQSMASGFEMVGGRSVLLGERIKEEFGTVDALLLSEAATRAADALILAWVKYEKQLRRLFCYLVFQHPSIGKVETDRIVAIIAANRELNPDSLQNLIGELCNTNMRELIGGRHDELARELVRIRRYRNKLVHGQLTGRRLQAEQLERDVAWVADWVDTLAEAAHQKYGYDGLQRNTARTARAARAVVVDAYPFQSSVEFEAWLTLRTERKRH